MRHHGWWLLAALAAGAAWALDPPRPAPAPAGTTAAAAAEEGQAEDAPAAPAVDDTVPPPAPATPSIGPTPQRFDPSEKVRADFPVSFPIDI